MEMSRESKLINFINGLYKTLIWLVLIINIILSIFTIRIHKEMAQERLYKQDKLENLVNALLEKRLKKPFKGD